MLLSNFDYELPNALIAHSPKKNRDDSRLLDCNIKEKKTSQKKFKEIVDILGPDDVLVFNDTKVINARLLAKRASGGKVECFLSYPQKAKKWLALLKPAKKLKEGERLYVSEELSFSICKKNYHNNLQLIELDYQGSLFDHLDRYGEVPLPPYIKTNNPSDFQKNYQCVFAKTPGAVAAPTAGLHFTEGLLKTLREKGVKLEWITLHIGYGTFSPINSESILDHKMHEERYSISEETAKRLNRYRGKKRVIAVGTTVVRALESAYKKDKVSAGTGSTDIFIYPGYQFQCIDALITNFHLPKSSLLLLVSAFASKDFILSSYQKAIKENYRFFSFGDAMFLHH